jgi:nostrin
LQPLHLKLVRFIDLQSEQPDELSLHPGDVITVLERNEDGWWVGEVNGKSGLFPGNHCELGSEK